MTCKQAAIPEDCLQVGCTEESVPYMQRIPNPHGRMSLSVVKMYAYEIEPRLEKFG